MAKDLSINPRLNQEGENLEIKDLQNIVRRYPEIEAAIRSRTGKSAAEVASSIQHVHEEGVNKKMLEEFARKNDLPIGNGRVVECSESLRCIRVFCAND